MNHLLLFSQKEKTLFIQKQENSAFLASRKGFEPPTPALGVPPEGSL